MSAESSSTRWMNHSSLNHRILFSKKVHWITIVSWKMFKNLFKNIIRRKTQYPASTLAFRAFWMRSLWNIFTSVQLWRKCLVKIIFLNIFLMKYHPKNHIRYSKNDPRLPLNQPKTRPVPNDLEWPSYIIKVFQNSVQKTIWAKCR